MPIYCYKCPSCGARKEVDKPMSQSKRPELCDNDGFVMQRDFNTEHPIQRSADKWPMASYAAGISPDEIPEMRKHDRAHGVPTDYTSDGDPIFTGPKHRKRYCQLHGLYDRNAGYSDPAPVNR